MARDEVVELQRRLTAAEAALEELKRGPRRPVRRRWRPGARGVAIGLALAILLAPLGVAATGDALREGVRNGTTRSETEIIGRFDATTAAKGGYVTRQSNVQTGPRAGGGAIYGCRGAAGGTGAGSAPCLRASNLADGLAFEFAAKAGPAGLFDVGSPTDPPFVTNGTGLVGNLNADKVDGLDADQLRGQQGPAGAAGPAGPRGEPGPTASAAANRFTDDVSLGDSEAEILSATITLERESRIIANATAEIAGDSGPGGAHDDVAACRLADPGGGWGFPQGTRVSIPPSPIPRANLAVTGAVVREAGTHEISVRCRKFAGTAAVVEESVLTVVAAAL